MNTGKLEFEIKVNTNNAEKKLEQVRKAIEKVTKAWNQYNEVSKSLNNINMSIIVEEKKDWKIRYWKLIKKHWWAYLFIMFLTALLTIVLLNL
jgi:hypothetical protein